MRLRYKRWMHDWETRLSTRDNNRVVRPLEWGLEWTQLWPLRNGSGPDQVSNAERALLDWNQRILADSDRFFSYQTPQDFRLESLDGKRGDTQVLRFTSPVETRYPENDVVTARWFPARGDRKSRAAVIVLPQWNSDGESHNGLCRIFSMLGISALRLSLPYHDTA